MAIPDKAIIGYRDGRITKYGSRVNRMYLHPHDFLRLLINEIECMKKDEDQKWKQDEIFLHVEMLLMEYQNHRLDFNSFSHYKNFTKRNADFMWT